MSARNLLLPIIGLVCTVWLLAGCGSKPTQPTPIPTPLPPPTTAATVSAAPTATIDFTGHWEDASAAFSLDLSQNGQHVQGSHVVVAQQGNKIDSLDKSIEGTIQGNTAVIHFQSSFTANSGAAQITFIDKNTISWKVTNPPEGEYYLPPEAKLVKTRSTPMPPPTPAAAIPAKSGAITGRVHLMAPPTPHMVVYAVDQTTGWWAFTETEATDGEAPFSLVVSPGSYQVYAFMDNGGYTAYSKDGVTLAVVTVAANQTVADIEVGPPGQSECGSMFGVPASPDGRFAAVAGPTSDCLATKLTPAAGVTPPPANPEATRIRFEPKAISWQTPGELAPNTSSRFVLSALKGQPMTVELTTVPDTGAGPAAAVHIWGADGQVFTPDITTRWKGVLTVSQDYYIEVRSLSPQNITYTLLVAIPAIGSTPYVPVTPEICQTLQRMATEALGVTFTMEASAPFTDPITGEMGQGCNLTATGTGRDFSDPSQVTAKLVSAFGFTEQPAYQANGPTGAATAATRDMALALISAEWTPAPEAKCPTDQPISACDLKPEQKLYTIQIQAAMK